jgi:hypothetical protein
LGADPDEEDRAESSADETTDEEEVDTPLAAIAEVEDKVSEDKRKQQQQYEVGEFVTAVYEGKWLLAQVDINQDEAGDTHVNLSYMQRVGENQFKWPKQHDLLLTLKEDILTRCSTPVMVGSSIRANHVGLPPKEALEADSALAVMVYLQYFLFQLFLNFLLFFTYFLTKIYPMSPINYDTVKYNTLKDKIKQIILPNFKTVLSSFR